MDWREGKIYTKAAEVAEFLKLSKDEELRLQEIVEVYPMAVTPYYLSLIDPEDPCDPIRKMCIPALEESALGGAFDTSGEAGNTVQNGLQHKYRETALILSTNRCAAYCRHCFRKRMVGFTDEEVAKNFEQTVQYIADHKELTNVLISGGDSFMMPNSLIRRYLEAFTAMEHLDLIRFGTRIPVVLPERILKDQEFQDIFREYAEKKQIYVVTQFNHPRELTEEARAAIRVFSQMGIVVKNQTVLLAGVNDDPQVLGELLRKLTASGVVPYYVFQCRPVKGVKTHFQVPLKRGLQIVDGAKNMQNGQAKCIRYCMSLPRGKVEVLGMEDEERMLFKFHQARDAADAAKLFSVKLEPGQGWLDKI